MELAEAQRNAYPLAGLKPDLRDAAENVVPDADEAKFAAIRPAQASSCEARWQAAGDDDAAAERDNPSAMAEEGARQPAALYTCRPKSGRA